MNPDGSSSPSAEQNLSLPNVGVGEILGLVELLKSKGGREDIYKLAAELKMEFGDTLNVIKGAELMGLVNTPGGDVLLEPLAEKIVKSRINQRKALLGEQIERIPVFKKLRVFLNEKEDHRASKDEVVDLLAELIPNENAEESFSTLVTWGRYAELFGYNDDTETFYLDLEEQSA